VQALAEPRLVRADECGVARDGVDRVERPQPRARRFGAPAGQDADPAAFELHERERTDRVEPDAVRQVEQPAHRGGQVELDGVECRHGRPQAVPLRLPEPFERRRGLEPEHELRLLAVVVRERVGNELRFLVLAGLVLRLGAGVYAAGSVRTAGSARVEQ